MTVSVSRIVKKNATELCLSDKVPSAKQGERIPMQKDLNEQTNLYLFLASNQQGPSIQPNLCRPPPSMINCKIIIEQLVYQLIIQRIASAER